MKALKLSLLALITSLTFVSCSKDKDEAVFVFEGSWSGKIGTGSGTPGSQFALNIKPGGVIERISSGGSVSGTGSWTLAGNEFAASYVLTSGTQVSLTGDLDPATKVLSGNWSNSSETGKWNVSHD